MHRGPVRMSRYAIVVDGLVANIALWDGTAKWKPNGKLVELSDDDAVNIGDSYDGKKFTPQESN